MEVVINGVRYAPVGGDAVAKSIEGLDTIAVDVLKAQEEKRWTLGLAYPCLKADAAVAADGHRDFIGPQQLERAAWTWMAKHRDVGLWHKDGVSNQATVVESHIHRGDPWVIKAADGSTVTVCEGDWLIACIWSEEAWPLVKSGAIRGFSPQGAARRRTPTAEELARLRS
jgi:hypothetical protein